MSADTRSLDIHGLEMVLKRSGKRQRPNSDCANFVKGGRASHPLASYDGVHMRCPDMYRMSDPLPMLAYGANRLERNQSALSLDDPGRLIQMRSPLGLALGIERQHRATGTGVFAIDPALF
jgi:hypothetical protein